MGEALEAISFDMYERHLEVFRAYSPPQPLHLGVWGAVRLPMGSRGEAPGKLLVLGCMEHQGRIYCNDTLRGNRSRDESGYCSSRDKCIFLEKLN